MNSDNEQRLFANKIRFALDQSADNVCNEVSERLHAARRAALARHGKSVTGLRLSGISHVLSGGIFQHGRTFAALAALVIGAAGTSYWNSYQQADENEEIDSALLADDLPINAYLDQGFHAWLERSTQPSPQ